MGRKELATLVDSYADAKVSGNKYLIQTMIAQLERAFDEVFGGDVAEENEVKSTQLQDEY